MAGIDNNTLLYLRGDSLKDLSVSPKTITNNGVVNEQGGLFGNRLYFNQNSFDVPIQFGTSDFTIEFFFNAKVWQAGTGASRLFSTGGYNHTNAFTCEIGSAMNFFIGSNGSTNKHVIQLSELSLNRNYHMAFVRNGNNYYVFIDGKKKITATISNLNFNYVAYTRFGGNAITTTGEYYHGYMENLRISNIARYVDNFEVPTAPYTSVSVNNIAMNDFNLSCDVNKPASNETINKVDITVNNNIVQTYTSNYNSISYTINKANLFYGDNSIEVRAYYYNNYYVYASTSCVKELILETFEPIADLLDTATFEDIISHLAKIKNANKTILNNLQTLLEDKGINTGDNPKLSNLVVAIKDLSNNNADINEYINRILALEDENSTLSQSNATLTNTISSNTTLLYNKLTSKGITGISTSSSFSALVSSIDKFTSIPTNVYLYNAGDECTSITGGWRTHQYDSYYSANIMTKASTYLEYGESNSSSYGYGGFLTNNAIDLTSYSTMVVKLQLVSFSGSAGSSLIISKTNSPNVRGDSFTSLASVTDKVATQEFTVDITKYTGTYYVGVYGHSGSYSDHVNKGRCHYIYLIR